MSTDTPTPVPFSKTFAADPGLLTTKDGVESYGFYVDFARYLKDGGAFEIHFRAFILENSFSLYTRERGKKSGRWATVYYDSFNAAVKQLHSVVTALDRADRVIEARHQPLLIQATVADLISIRKRDKRGPNCRWRGINRVDVEAGKLDDTARVSV